MVSLIIYLYMYVVYQAAAKPACPKQHPECDYWKSRDTCVTLQMYFLSSSSFCKSPRCPGYSVRICRWGVQFGHYADVMCIVKGIHTYYDALIHVLQSMPPCSLVTLLIHTHHPFPPLSLHTPTFSLQGKGKWGGGGGDISGRVWARISH